MTKDLTDHVRERDESEGPKVCTEDECLREDDYARMLVALICLEDGKHIRGCVSGGRGLVTECSCYKKILRYAIGWDKELVA